MPARSPVSDVNIDAPALLSIAIALSIAIVGAYALGKRHSQRARRELQRTLSGRELELLEARAEIARLAESLTGTPARERLLKLAMTRLGRARERERHLFVEVTRLRLSAAESAARLKAAVALARRAARRARELASADGAIGTITTRAPKSYGNGKAVTVRVVDHETPAAKLDGAARVPHRERARFAPPAAEQRAAIAGRAGPVGDRRARRRRRAPPERVRHPPSRAARGPRRSRAAAPRDPDGTARFGAPAQRLDR